MKKSVVAFFITSLILLAGALGTLYWYIMNQTSKGERIIDFRTEEQKTEEKRVDVQNALEQADKEQQQQNTVEKANDIQKALEALDKQNDTNSNTGTSGTTSTSSSVSTEPAQPQFFFGEPDPEAQRKADEISKALKSAN
jgi:hypothetical protein